MAKPIEACDCSQGSKKIQNTGGHLSCGKGVARFKYAVFGNLLKENGGDNGIVVGTDVVDATYMNDKFIDPIRANRWYPLEGLLTDYDSPIVADNVEEIDDGRIFFLNKVTKEVTTSIITDEPFVLAGKLEANICHLDGVMFFDTNNSMVGHLKSETSFTFLKIQKGSFRVGIVNNGVNTKGRVQLIWKWDESAIETQTDYYTVAAMGGFNYSNDITALIDGNISDLMVTAANSTFKLEMDYGGAPEGERIGLGGLDETNLEIWNVSDSVVVANTGIVETANLGEYVGTHTAPLTIGKEVRIQPIGGDIHIGYDLVAIPDTVVISVA